jgi:hypothetical protein
VRRIKSAPASLVAHAAIVGLGFEGTVLKRPNSVYRPGRHRAWLKHKARHTADAVLLAVRQDRDGHWHGVCDVDGRRVVALAGASSADLVGELVSLVYSRVDADRGLREVRVAAPTPPTPAGHIDRHTRASAATRAGSAHRGRSRRAHPFDRRTTTRQRPSTRPTRLMTW